MSNYIQSLLAELTKIEEQMKMLLPAPSCYEDLLSLYILYKECQHTNAIIDYADAVLQSGEAEELTQLLEDAKALNQKAAECYQLYLDSQQAFDAIDNNALIQAHIKPFLDAEEAEAKTALPFWKEYQHLSNRLDYVTFESEEYNEMLSRCDAAKAAYDTHHAKVDELYEKRRKEENRCTVALMFKVEDLSLVFIYMQRIAQSIIETITKEKGE